MAEKDAYKYRCGHESQDPGHVRCDFEYAAEDRADVEAQANEHRMMVHDIQDTNPEIVQGLIEMQRLEV